MRVGAKVGAVKPGLMLLGAALAAMLLLAAPASAKKTHLFLETFGSVEQPVFEHSNDLALDPSSGDLLIIDPGTGAFHGGTVSRFKPNGEADPFSALGTNTIDAKKGPGGKACAEEPSSCDDAPQAGFSFNSFGGTQQVVVDDSGTITDGDIYVTDYEPTFGGGLDYAGHVTIFASDGHYLGQLTAAGGTPIEKVCGATVDAGGNVYIAEWRPREEIVEGGKFIEERDPEGRIYKFDPSANPPLSSDHVATFTTPELFCQVAAGAGPTSGSLFAKTYYGPAKTVKLNAAGGAVEGVIPGGGSPRVDPFNGHVFTVGGFNGGAEFDASGASPVFLSGIEGPYGTASNSAIERVYSSTGNKEVQVLGPIVTLPEATSGSYELLGDTAIRVKGTVNPDGQALTECFFEYDTNSFVFDVHPGKEGEPSHGQTAPCEAPDIAEIGAAPGPVEVHADLSGLQGETDYHYRLVVRNANAALYPKDPRTAVFGSDRLAKTPSKPEIKGTWAQDVVTTDATLKATVNPGNSSTTYRFEWGLAKPPLAEEPYEHSSAEFSLGSGDADRTAGAIATGLEPATTYHYRVVATNGIGVSEGADHRFTTYAVPVPPGGECENQTFRTGFGALLPDCRAYEMVSPIDKAGGDIQVPLSGLGVPLALEQAADSGEKLAYGSLRAFGDSPGAGAISQYIAQRVEGEEWTTHGISPPRGRSLHGVASEFLLRPQFEAFSPDLCQAWLRNLAEPPLAPGALPGIENTYRRVDGLCTEDGQPHYEALAPLSGGQAEIQLVGQIQLVGHSGDGLRAFFEANGKLAEDAAPGVRQLYESVEGGQPRTVCVLPDGRTSACAGGSNGGDVSFTAAAGKVSADGSRVFWSDATEGEGHLYLRQNPDQPESPRLHGSASGKGDLIGPATGSANVVGGSELVTSVKPTSGGFAIGQEISDSAGKIPANTKVKACSPDCSAPTQLTLTAKASGLALGDTLTGAASATVPGVVTESGAFTAGQEISAANEGIPAGATVVSCTPSCGPAATSLTLSAKATKTKAAAALSATSPCTEAATKACTISVSKAAEEEAGATDNAFFWGASKTGAKAIFTTGAVFGFDNGDPFLEAEATLYSFGLEGEVTTPIAAGVGGVMGISANADRVYFASKEVLSGEEENSDGDKAQADEPNLYLYEAGEGGGISFIGTLAQADLRNAVGASEFKLRTARVAPDGAHAAFVSQAPLTGYDNISAAGGTACGNPGDPCDEVYRYDATEGKLTCASCNPAGARPAGLAGMRGYVSALQGPGSLSADGRRLFFASGDALTPRDTNGRIDVYQWEEAGAGPPGAECSEALPTYSPQDEGCIDLVSSGKSPFDARFVDATLGGEDVFIATNSSLLPQDPGGLDVYDARALGGLPIPQGPAPGCEGEACQSAPEAPNDPTPASASFEGAGNVHEEAPLTRTPCAKGKVRRKGRCVARHHKRAKQRAKRHRGAGR